MKQTSKSKQPEQVREAPGNMQQISVADEVWVAAALLHQEQPEQDDFTAREITARAERENIIGRLRPGVYVHASHHCVANRPPNPGRYRMLFATGKTRRRLFRPGDAYDAKRDGSKTVPERSALPTRYQPLIDWYEQVYVSAASPRTTTDPILALRGLGKEVWGGENPDDYVERMRRGWT
jgi:hypothetical protein